MHYRPVESPPTVLFSISQPCVPFHKFSFPPVHLSFHRPPVIIFVDNSGAYIILGILPFARKLLRRGTQVCFHYGLF
ncbi:hypothetical protein I3843_09G155300 [Carya illinoinensis]|uniref:Uncharacterized protein n=1 Tax=Carya illinoinensis TaxID=32201 RepID=A0A922J877_CARIL|nr:hypothetical protein I3842_09G160600 [Carya illinoinensis]KAG7964161.1 hypothetical protein I3843_09G155300 [Carya illinoinensis]